MEKTLQNYYFHIAILKYLRAENLISEDEFLLTKKDFDKEYKNVISVKEMQMI